MRVLLIADLEWDRLGASYGRSFERLGHAVSGLDTRTRGALVKGWVRHRVAHRITIRSLGLRRKASTRWNRVVLERARAGGADLVLVLDRDFLMPETIRALRADGRHVAILHPDSPFPPAPGARPEHLAAAEAADDSFIWSRRLAAELRRRGARRTSYLPFGWDPEVFPPVDPAREPEHDVVFIGGWDPDRERWLARVAERFDLRIWGPDYWGLRTRRGGALRRCWQGGAVRGPEAARVIGRAAVTLNILRRQNLPDGTNMRTFEVPGCGGFLLSTRTAGSTEILPEGVAAGYFTGIDELLVSLDRFLRDPEARRAMAAAGARIVRDGHRYEHRTAGLLSRLRAS